MSAYACRHKRNIWKFVFLFVCICSILLIAFDLGPNDILATRWYSNEILESPSFNHAIHHENLNVIVLGADKEGTFTSDKVATSAGAVYSRGMPFRNDVEFSCNIPLLDVNGSEVMNFFHHVKHRNCKSAGEDWVYVNSDRYVRVTDYAKKQFGTIACKMMEFVIESDNRVHYMDGVHFSDQTRMEQSDFARVSCRNSRHQEQTSYVMTIVPNERRREELLNVKKPSDWSGLDVYFLGFDSVSHMTFRRKLPATVKFLEEELDGVVLNGYNIVGDGTPQAFIPILTAKTEEELPLTRKRYKNAHFVDEVYPFAWRNFSDAGYVTMFAEDSAAIGTYTYRLKGFKRQPTDHYLRTYFVEAEKQEGNLQCLGHHPLYEDWFRYVSEFMRRYVDIPRFVLAHQSLYSHDSLNEVEVEDQKIVQHFRDLIKSNALNKSIIIVMADHGHRFAEIRATHQGQLEERLPFFSIALPRWFRESERGKIAWRNLQENKNRLTTPFDIHATLMDILHWPTNDEIIEPVASTVRSISLFKSVPLSRTCAQAGIDPHWCTCLVGQSAMGDQDYNFSQLLAKIAVEVFNNHTASERSLCAPLKLVELVDSKRMMPDSKLLKYKSALDKDGFLPDLSGTTMAKFAYYQVKLRTMPGSALYEVTLLFDWNIMSVTIDLKSVSHINRYGAQPHCIIDKNYFLAMFCVCYDKI